MPAAGAVVPPIITPIRRPVPGKPGTHIDTSTFVELETETPDCKIYFSTDGTKPNPFQLKVGGRESTFKYRGPFTLKNGKRTLKVVAVSRDGLQESNVVSKTFTVEDVGPPGKDDMESIDLGFDETPRTTKRVGRKPFQSTTTKKKNLRNSTMSHMDYAEPKEAWATSTYTPAGVGHICGDSPDLGTTSNSVNIPDGPFNPTNYSGTQLNFWGVAPSNMPGQLGEGGYSGAYPQYPSQLGYLTNQMLQNIDRPKMSMADLKKLIEQENLKNQPPPQPAITYPKEPELNAKSPGNGDWKGQLEHVYAHTIEQCKQDPMFRNALGTPVMGKLLTADFDEEDTAYLITLSFAKPGVKRAPPKPQPKPQPKPEPKPQPKPQAKAKVDSVRKPVKKPEKPPEKKLEKPKPPKAAALPEKDPYLVTEEYQADPTLKPWPAFDSEKDCEALRKAMKGVGTDERAITDIMGFRTATQRQEIVTLFKTMFGKDLREELAGETSGDYKECLKALCLTPPDYDANEIKRAVKGLGTDDDALVEILCTRTNAQINAMKLSYTKLFNKDLEKDVKDDTSGDFQRVLMSQINAKRDESPTYDLTLAQKDAELLFKAGEGKWGTDESTFNKILCQRSFAHLRAVFEEYGKLSKKDFEDAIKSEFSGDIKNSLLTMVRVIRYKPAYFAKKLQKSMKGLGTDDSALIRIIVSRCECDMVQIKESFEQQFSKGLGEWIKDDTSGDNGMILMSLSGDRDIPMPSEEEIEEANAEPELEEVEEEEIEETPTLVPAEPFDPKADCEVLKKAMKGLGTDEKAIIGVMACRTTDQRLEIIKTYRTMFGKDLIKELQGELSGNFEDLIIGLCMSKPAFDATQLRSAMKGLGTDEDCLMEILCTRTNAELDEIIKTYEQLNSGRKLEKDIISETSGNLKRLLVSMLQANRPEGNVIDRRKARKDAKDLLEAGEKKFGTDESRFNVILCSRSYPQLRATFEEYALLANKEVEDAIKSEMSGDLKKGMLTIVQCVRNKQQQFAKTLYESMKGLGTKDNSLIRTCVTRCEVDMVQIKDIFQTMYSQSLGEFIKDDTSGDYRRTLLTLVGEQQLIKK